MGGESRGSPPFFFMPESFSARVRLPWKAPLVHGVLLRRRQRFLADVLLDSGAEVTAHCPNPGAMEGLVRAGARVWLEPSTTLARRLAFTWVAVEDLGVMVGVDTLRPNALVRELLSQRAIACLGAFSSFTPEVVHAPGSRVDFRLSTPRGPHDVEVKNCHLVYPDRRGYFPDCVSSRATRHMAVLEAARAEGHRCSVLFVVQREDVEAVRPSEVHDPAFARASRQAHRAGVRFFAVRARPTPDGLEAIGTIPVEFSRYAPASLAAWRLANKPFSGWIRSSSSG